MPIQFVHVHGIKPVLQLPVLPLKTSDRLIVAPLLILVALLESLGRPTEHLNVELQASEDFTELFRQYLLPDIRLGAFSLVASAVIVDIAAFLSLPRQ